MRLTSREAATQEVGSSNIKMNEQFHMNSQPSESSSGTMSVSAAESLADKELSEMWKDDEMSQVEASLDSQERRPRLEEEGFKTQPKRATKRVIPQRIGDPKQKIKSTINNPEYTGLNIFGRRINGTHEAEQNFIGRREEEKQAPQSPQRVPSKERPRNCSTARRKALDDLGQQHRIPGQFTAELAKEEIRSMESLDQLSRLEPKDVDKAVHSILPSLHLDLGTLDDLRKEKEEVIRAKLALVQEKARGYVANKKLEDLVRRSKVTEIPGVYPYTKSADPFIAEHQAMVFDRDLETQRKLVPPFPKATIEAIKNIVDSFPHTSDQHVFSEEAQEIRDTVAQNAFEARNCNINEVFSDSNSKARIGLEAIDFPAGIINPYPEMNAEDEEWLSKLIFDREPPGGKRSFCDSNEKARARGISIDQLFPSKVISPNGDAKILREICSVDKEDIHSVKVKLYVDWEVFDMRTVHQSIPNGWMLRNATITSKMVQGGRVPVLKGIRVFGFLFNA